MANKYGEAALIAARMETYGKAITPAHAGNRQQQNSTPPAHRPSAREDLASLSSVSAKRA